MSPFEFKLAIQNIDRIWVWLQKQSCRTFNLEQLLFLEIFELPCNFGSNLRKLVKGNSVNMVNSARRLSYTAGDLLLASRRARGRVRLRAAMGKVAAWLLLASWPPFKACAVAVLLISSSLLFPSPPLNSDEPVLSP